MHSSSFESTTSFHHTETRCIAGAKPPRMNGTVLDIFSHVHRSLMRFAVSNTKLTSCSVWREMALDDIHGKTKKTAHTQHTTQEQCVHNALCYAQAVYSLMINQHLAEMDRGQARSVDAITWRVTRLVLFQNEHAGRLSRAKLIRPLRRLLIETDRGKTCRDVLTMMSVSRTTSCPGQHGDV